MRRKLGKTTNTWFTEANNDSQKKSKVKLKKKLDK